MRWGESHAEGPACIGRGVGPGWLPDGRAGCRTAGLAAGRPGWLPDGRAGCRTAGLGGWQPGALEHVGIPSRAAEHSIGSVSFQLTQLNILLLKVDEAKVPGMMATFFLPWTACPARRAVKGWEMAGADRLHVYAL
jgi:hypothetical protein